MKKITLFILIILTLACSNDSDESIIESKELLLPEWLKCEYIGVHTKEFLSISDEEVKFKLDNEIYTYQDEDIVSQAYHENQYVLETSMAILQFNKTTINTEINLRWNNLNLGWFRNKVE
ncbi:MAG: hypothetical protein ACOVQR_09230 [Flavobacterium sp.]|uniref:hypothetical protein n=1 Tax=Flavobacterium sp. TaxID=239 RepID=UPI003BA5C180